MAGPAGVADIQIRSAVRLVQAGRAIGTSRPRGMSRVTFCRRSRALGGQQGDISSSKKSAIYRQHSQSAPSGKKGAKGEVHPNLTSGTG